MDIHYLRGIGCRSGAIYCLKVPHCCIYLQKFLSLKKYMAAPEDTHPEKQAG
jgi:hypothetical protein